jgi:hypothetical protein
LVILLLMINCHGNKTEQPIELISGVFEEDSEEEGEDNGGGEIKYFLFIREWEEISREVHILLMICPLMS